MLDLTQRWIRSVTDKCFLYRCCCTSVLLRLHSKGHHLKDLLIFFNIQIHLLLLLYFCICQTTLEGHLPLCPSSICSHTCRKRRFATIPSTHPTQNPDPTDRRAQKLYMWNSLVACMSNICHKRQLCITPFRSQRSKFDSFSSSRYDFRG